MVEGYCVRCRQGVEVEEPQAVWTRRGMPATRGICPDCGGTIFRMGRTELHDELKRPDAVGVTDAPRIRLAPHTAYLNFAAADAAFAHRLAHDLETVGIAVWLHRREHDDADGADAAHPALTACASMIVVLSEASLADPEVAALWDFFRQNHKPIAIARAAPVAPPDALRRSPRFDLSADYTAGFRQLVQTLND